MTDPVFQRAYELVRGSYSADGWAALTPRQITEAIYREIRRLDADRTAAVDMIGHEAVRGAD